MNGSLHNKCLLFVGTLVFCLSYDTTMYCVSWPTEICWRCRASKGNECFDTVYTDFSSTAGWRSMGFSNPWQTKPFLAELWGWDPQLHMVSVDLLHVLHLGVYRDLAGSAIKVLLRKQGYYDGSKLLIRFKFSRESSTPGPNPRKPHCSSRLLRKLQFIGRAISALNSMPKVLTALQSSGSLPSKPNRRLRPCMLEW